ncbi:MAG: tetratricopeptide repeat protein [Candidatus Tectomicrobia bacterium]|uniref:Tetratricopeptide repeat protein n=1 Tax=Tectimicrobiota bacterium TaxID=2528274 RepID=A0A933GKF4_UNCTE|nr:tetratricopeptide repeat protein [Candidatus Tectomicrobia bacterium]
MAEFIWTQSDLMRLGQHKKAIVRRWACERMKALYGKEGIGILERLLRDKERSVLLEALDYLEDYPEPGFRDTLLEVYTAQKGAVASKSAVLLGKLKDDRFLSAYQKKRTTGKIEFDELIGIIDGLGELATEEAKTILWENLSEIPEDCDTIFISALVRALLQAGEDLSSLLNYNARHYKSFALEILYPLASLCGSWYSLADLKEKGGKRLFRKTLPYAVSDSLTSMRRIGFSSLAKDLGKAFEKLAFRQIIEVAWGQAEKMASERGINAENACFPEASSPPLVNYRVLRAMHEFLNQGPEDSLEEMALIATIIFSNLIEFKNALGLKAGEMDDPAMFKVLFDDRGWLEIDDLLSDKILKTLDHKVILDRCLQEMKNHPSSWGTERAIRLLTKLKDEKALPALFDFCKTDHNEAALEECPRAIAAIGIPSVNYGEKHFDQLDDAQILEVLFALRNVSAEETADFILRHWDKLWSLHKEPLLYVVEKVGSRRFIDPLRKELREGEVTEEEVFYLLCHIHGVDDILIPRIEKILAKHDQEVEQRMKTLEKDPKGLLEKSVRMELKCLECHKAYHYDVENIYIPRKGKAETKIADKIVCKNCRAVNRYEITTMGHFAITSHLVLMAALTKKGEKLDPEKNPFKMVETGLTDGRRMSFEKALEHYRKEVARSPKDPALRVGYGNILMKTGEAGEAILQYREALRLDPMAVEAYCCIGEYEGDRGKFSLAYDYFKKAADCSQRGHYYRTKEPDQLKEAIFDNLEHYGEILSKRSARTSLPPSSEIGKTEKVGRNAPCPCGSGKKYKKCCLNKEERK